MANYKIYWYRLIPFVIAECRNREWNLLEPLIKTKKLTMLTKIYNTNGNWYVLEGLDYFFLGSHIYSSDRFLFSDSMSLRFLEMSDENRRISLIEEAQEDIDKFWSNFYNYFTINYLINKIKTIYGKANTFFARGKK